MLHEIPQISRFHAEPTKPYTVTIWVKSKGVQNVDEVKYEIDMNKEKKGIG